MIVLEDDEVFFLRKTPDGFSYFNKATRQFELLNDFVAAQTGLAAKWIIFIFETDTPVFSLKELRKTLIDQNKLEPTMEPDVWSITTVQGLLPTFTRSCDVGPVQMQQSHIDLLLDTDDNLNDLIINGHLFISSTTTPTDCKAFAVQSHSVSHIIDNRLRRFEQSWLKHDMILCPINQNQHWYIVILDLKEKLVVELDSMPSHNLNRSRNRERLLHVLDTQYYLKNNRHLDIQNEWQLATPLTDLQLQQDDQHSCGVHLLVQARAYVNKRQFSVINHDNVRLHRFKLAEAILRKAELTGSDSDYSLSDFSHAYVS